MDLNYLILIIVFCLVPLLAITVGLLIFFLGRRHVRRKYGNGEGRL